MSSDTEDYSDENENANEIISEYSENEEQEIRQERYERYKQRLKEQGIELPASNLGDSIHIKTLRSYHALKMDVPDSPTLAAKRPAEKLKHNLIIAGKKPKITTIIRQIYRLREKEAKKEWLTYSYDEIFEDLHGNEHKLEYTKVGAYEIVIGKRKLDVKGNLTAAEITGKRVVYDIPFTKKNLEDILKKQSSEVESKPELYIGVARLKGAFDTRPLHSTEDKLYLIRNLEDFKQGTWEQLLELGRRALSEDTPSLSKLSQPISNDPNTSLVKRERGYLNPSAVSYIQGAGFH